VQSGDLLVRMDEKDLLSEKASAETDLEGTNPPLQRAIRDFNRSQELFSKKLVSRQIFDNSRTDMEIAKNNYEKAQRRLQIVADRLSKTTIRSPMHGTVLTIPVSEGQVVVAAASVNAGTTLMSIADLSQLSINTLINQVDVAQIRHEHEVTFTTDALPQTPIKGRVHFIAPVATVKNNIKGFEVRVLVGENRPEIRPGMSADVLFPIAEIKNALSLPVSAVFFEKNQAFVHVKNPASPSNPIRREVQTGLNTFHHIEIKSGIGEDEDVLLIPADVWRDKNKKKKY